MLPIDDDRLDARPWKCLVKIHKNPFFSFATKMILWARAGMTSLFVVGNFVCDDTKLGHAETAVYAVDTIAGIKSEWTNHT